MASKKANPSGNLNNFTKYGMNIWVTPEKSTNCPCPYLLGTKEQKVGFVNLSVDQKNWNMWDILSSEKCEQY